MEERDRREPRDADVTLFLVSADFLASDYCYEIEVKRAMERHETGETTVVPILVRHCDWHAAPFGKVQGLPEGADPVKEFEGRDKAWAGVATALRVVVEKITKKPRLQG